jgi:2-oxoglutarate ferredoxin oxidoreductase subunit alpha
MNDWMCKRLKWDDNFRPDRGKVLGAEELKQVEKFFRYVSNNGDGVAARTLPGVSAKGAYFVRGSGHNKFGGYTEDSVEYREVVDRIARKIAGAAEKLPAPEIIDNGSDTGLIVIGSARGASLEALDRLRERGINLDFMRIKAFPFSKAVHDFVHSHERCIVLEQNRDGQLRSLLMLETEVGGDKFISIRDYGGLPLGTEWVIGQLAAVMQGEEVKV